MKESEFIDAMAEVIDRDGWCQGKMYDHEGHACLMGAAGRVWKELDVSSPVPISPSEHRWLYENTIRRLNKAVHEKFGFAFRDVYDWDNEDFMTIDQATPGDVWGQPSSVVQFNDADTTSAEDVKLFLKSVAAEAEAEGC